MSEQVSRQIALITVFATCILTIVLIVALGLGAQAGTALTQAVPLALVCAAALAYLLNEPFRYR